MIAISYCMTCMGRLHHLKETLPCNLEWNRDSRIEFVLLDYSSPDNLGSWVRDNLGAHLAQGRLRYFRTEGASEYISAHAKNVAHRLATGDILCNLDADNFTGPNFSDYLLTLFSGRDQLLIRGPFERLDACGRIALRSADFHRLGGYDEDFIHGWGHDDWDLAGRAEAMGMQTMFFPVDSPFLEAIRHSASERAQYNACKDIYRSNGRHKSISDENIRAGRYVANVGRDWGKATVVEPFKSPWGLLAGSDPEQGPP